MSEESTLSFRGLCRYIHRLSKASKAGMKAALADCPTCHFPMLEGLLGCIRLHGQDGAVYISDLVQELHQPLPAISRTVRQITAGMSGNRAAVISPAAMILPAVAMTSQATWAAGSCSRQTSTTASAMVSQSLSGWPSVTDSAVKTY